MLKTAIPDSGLVGIAISPIIAGNGVVSEIAYANYVKAGPRRKGI